MATQALLRSHVTSHHTTPLASPSPSSGSARRHSQHRRALPQTLSDLRGRHNSVARCWCHTPTPVSLPMARRLLAPHFLPHLRLLAARCPGTPPSSSPSALAITRCRSAGPSAPLIWTPAGTRFFADDHSHYDLFGKRRPGDEEFRKAWQENVDEEDCLWTGSEDEEEENDTKLEREIKKVKRQAKENANLIDADDTDELRSICSESDEDNMALWSGSEDDDDDDIPTDAHPNERSDSYIDKVFEFDEAPKYRTISELLKSEKEPPELSPGKQARKLAVENALKKLKKGPDGRYINVFDVVTDIDILIGAFENIVSGPEYAELREGGPKKLNIQFFKDIQARMRDPNFKFSPELKLKPKSKLVPRKKWQKAQARKRKNERR
ncbi:hypothetical protein E2562_023549 [Oryza meyeriana var. granulata]|uniref:Uncharacterized protein n=1 Tax=Oryza meyeriana var. granulata TaxID=110450 RepID=A0A6G1E0T4_9ORYZ|nr:hypothetical protein E2562_023549 [Oryza meyeriana var. granulata]KAF0918390.1 hypothetical protein E2562_023549 [Oryza meyeriana var. granulata]KAF0918391.1 hypothetical protein E2562_023549 [Oryza meyeriana var. granulata]KAF0918392.1 hypothetical protein E2562_023549 [Oryza meyeriana var. granulata]